VEERILAVVRRLFGAWRTAVATRIGHERGSKRAEQRLRVQLARSSTLQQAFCAWWQLLGHERGFKATEQQLWNELSESRHLHQATEKRLRDELAEARRAAAGPTRAEPVAICPNAHEQRESVTSRRVLATHIALALELLVRGAFASWRAALQTAEAEPCAKDFQAEVDAAAAMAQAATAAEQRAAQAERRATVSRLEVEAERELTAQLRETLKELQGDGEEAKALHAQVRVRATETEAAVAEAKEASATLRQVAMYTKLLSDRERVTKKMFTTILVANIECFVTGVFSHWRSYVEFNRSADSRVPAATVAASDLVSSGPIVSQTTQQGPRSRGTSIDEDPWEERQYESEDL
jgi:uncharacterized protein (UPF0335 family)